MVNFFITILSITGIIIIISFPILFLFEMIGCVRDEISRNRNKRMMENEMMCKQKAWEDRAREWYIKRGIDSE